MSRIGKKPISDPVRGQRSRSNPNTKTNTDRGRGAEGQAVLHEYRPEVTVDLGRGRETDRLRDPRGRRCSLGQMRAYVGHRSRSHHPELMIQGVSEGYEKKLEIIGVGWNAQMPRASRSGSTSATATRSIITPPDGRGRSRWTATRVIVTGSDKQAVGQFAAVVRSKRPPEPYNGKGIKYDRRDTSSASRARPFVRLIRGFPISQIWSFEAMKRNELKIIRRKRRKAGTRKTLSSAVPEQPAADRVPQQQATSTPRSSTTWRAAPCAPSSTHGQGRASPTRAATAPAAAEVGKAIARAGKVRRA